MLDECVEHFLYFYNLDVVFIENIFINVLQVLG